MSDNNLLLQFVSEAHDGQYYAQDMPYIEHLKRVAENFETFSLLYMVALLHDIFEDTNYTFIDLMKVGISQRVINIVNELTRRYKEPYLEYIKRVKKHPNACAVKCADVIDNYEYTYKNMTATNEDKMLSLRKRYKKALKLLND